MGIISKAARRLYARQGLLIIIAAALALEATSVIQFYFSKKGIREEATRRAESELEMTSLRIRDVMNQVETAVRNNIPVVEAAVSNPRTPHDSLYGITRRIVADNPVIFGSAVAMNPLVGKSETSPYAFRESDSIGVKELATEAYAYTQTEWFTAPLRKGGGHWSEPYFDEGGGEQLMTTYSIPFHDSDGKMAGVMTADISLDWLTDLVGNLRVYPNAYSVMLSRTGQIMVSPVETLTMRSTVQEVAGQMHNSATVRTLADEMMAGKRGAMLLRQGDAVSHIFYAPVERAGWSMAIVIPNDAIYGNVKRLGMAVRLLQLLGLCILLFVILRTVRSQIKLREVEERKDRIENELKIARDIQMSMLPKTYPPYPERHDLDMFGKLVSAKEVGGDLFDFFIRDENLFFCIGDVSGKGIPASLLMAVTRSLFRTVSAHESAPEKIMADINDTMAESNERNMFVTFFLGVLSLGKGVLHFCNAGHNAPVFLSGGTVKMLEVIPNLPLGVMQGMEYAAQEVLLRKGDTLFLYTDGLTEAENERQELFGERRLKETLSRAGAMDAEHLVLHADGEVVTHAGDAPQSDDKTMLAVRYLGEGSKGHPERHLTLQNDIRQLPQLAEFVEAVAEEAALPPSLTMSLNLALEEAVTNVVLYAYPEGTDGTVDITAILQPEKEISFVISDSGKAFDPTQAKEADTSLGVEERPIGGLGIHLVRKIMDTVSYERTDGRNILTMKKRL